MNQEVDPVAELEKKIEEENRKKNKAMGITSDLDLLPEKEAPSNTYSYARSKRAVEFRLKDGFDQGVADIENDKFKLVKRLNEHLIELDGMNEEKRSLSQKLIDQIKFVREL